MKLNLHLHTVYSDGNNTVEEMALWLRSLGHCCLVTSDHDYYMSPEKYESQLVESAEVSKRLGFPIINALEISLWTEEAVLVGVDACRRWLAERQKPEHRVLGGDTLFNHTWKTMPRLLDGMNYGLCLVHPGLREQLDYGMFHAYEVMNSGSPWSAEDVARMKELMPVARPVRGMDCHSVRVWEERQDPYLNSCNEVADPIESEDQIIAWLRGHPELSGNSGTLEESSTSPTAPVVKPLPGEEKQK